MKSNRDIANQSPLANCGAFVSVRFSVNAREFMGTARTLVAAGKGLLAMDESNPTCNRRSARLGIPETKEARRAYREVIVITPGLGGCISGAILYDETIRQRLRDGTPLVKALADATVRCLLPAVPAALPGIAFLSDRQPGELASARLNAMNARFKGRLPWALLFSFAHAIQQPALEIWRGSEANVLQAQKALYHRARCSQAARRGEYRAAMEGVSA